MEAPPLIPKLRRVGLSQDGRTNRWEVTPSCGHKTFEPMTTMRSTGFVQCPRCGAEYFINYNAPSIEPV